MPCKAFSSSSMLTLHCKIGQSASGAARLGKGRHSAAPTARVGLQLVGCMLSLARLLLAKMYWKRPAPASRRIQCPGGQFDRSTEFHVEMDFRQDSQMDFSSTRISAGFSKGNSIDRFRKSFRIPAFHHMPQLL